MRGEDRYLQKRGRQWHYVRRVPASYQLVDPRRTIRVALRTPNLEIARARRDAMESADDDYWAGLLALPEGGRGANAGAHVRDALTATLRRVETLTGQVLEALPQARDEASSMPAGEGVLLSEFAAQIAARTRTLALNLGAAGEPGPEETGADGDVRFDG